MNVIKVTLIIIGMAAVIFYSPAQRLPKGIIHEIGFEEAEDCERNGGKFEMKMKVEVDRNLVHTYTPICITPLPRQHW
jgi:hypothetical protein